MPEADLTARLAALLGEHRLHASAVLAEAGVGFVTEAERERDRIEALIEASSLGTPEAKAARESVPRSTASAIVVAAKHLARAECAESALEKVRALADAWERDAARACDGADHSGCPDCDGKVYAADLRAAIGGTP